MASWRLLVYKKSLFTKVTRASSWKSSPAIFKLGRQRYDQKGLFLFWRHCWWHDLYFVVVILLLFSHYSWTGHTTALQITLNGLSCPNRLTERSERVQKHWKDICTTISSDRSNRSSSSSSSVELESSMRFGGSIEPLKSSMVRSIEPKSNQIPT